MDLLKLLQPSGQESVSNHSWHDFGTGEGFSQWPQLLSKTKNEFNISLIYKSHIDETFKIFKNLVLNTYFPKQYQD